VDALKRKYNNFKKCYESLGKAIATQKLLENISRENSDARNLFSAGIIQHFELTYETAWKFLKQYLAVIHGSNAASPKQVFRECEMYRLFPPHITNEFITLADARNTTTHIYDQILAQEVCDSIIKHHEAFGKILNLIQIPE
jgi:nucleotidyltransferase substrate binding protein (TIGR01987 family)